MTKYPSPTFTPTTKNKGPHFISLMDWFSWLSKTNLETTLVYEYGLEFTRNELQLDDIRHFNHEFLMSMGIAVAKHRLEILKLAKKEVSGLNKPLFDLKRAIRKTKKSVSKYIGRLMSHDHDDDGASKVSSMEAFANTNNNYGQQWREALARKCKSEKEFKQEIMVKRNRSLALSGPLEKRLFVPQRTTQLSGPLVYTSKSPIASGPLDVSAHEKALLALRSPKLSESGPLDGWTTNRSPRMVAFPPGKGFRSSPRLSGPLDGMGLRSPARSPRLFGNLERDEFDEHSLWAKMFQDMKPT